MRRIKTKLCFFCFVFLCTACSSTGYLIDMGIGQWKIFNRSLPIEDVLKNPRVSSKTKEAILLIQDIKNYAVKDLGLEVSHSYNEYVKVDGKYITWLVTASHPIYLKLKKWHFPIVGNMPYIGFFNKEKAEKYLEELRTNKKYWYKEGFIELPPDLHMRGSSAYSSLGWFSDPLYSSMISKSKLSMANLTIHESVHSTIFISSKVSFNERLASFIAAKGALLYIQKKYGNSSKEVKEARESMLQSKVFYAFINAAIDEYKKTVELKAKESIFMALEEKKKFFKNLPDLYRKISRNFAFKYIEKTYEDKLRKWNNAILLSNGVYFRDFSIFERLYISCAKNLRLFIETIKTAYEKNKESFKDDPDLYLRTLNCS